jgi:hypothetical protein
LLDENIEDGVGGDTRAEMEEMEEDVEDTF